MKVPLTGGFDTSPGHVVLCNSHRDWAIAQGRSRSMPTFNIDARYIHMKGADVRLSQYADGSLALTAEAEDEEGYPDRETLSVNLTGWGVPAPPADHIYVPTWSEHEGLPEALEAAGIATSTGEGFEGPHGVVAVVMHITEAVSA